MSQLFPPSANTVAKLSLCALFAVFFGIVLVWYFLARSPYTTKIGVTQDQTVPFSHKHHVDGLGIDCRFCHISAEKSSFAGIPTTETCMKCHSVIWKDSPMLEPVRESFRTGKPLVWKRVHDLGDFTYFDHSIHINKGVACVTCHGQVDQMPLVWKSESLRMEWCLECHRNPKQFIRPKEEVFNMDWQPPADEAEMKDKLWVKYHVQSMTNCNVCHR